MEGYMELLEGDTGVFRKFEIWGSWFCVLTDEFWKVRICKSWIWGVIDIFCEMRFGLCWFELAKLVNKGLGFIGEGEEDVFGKGVEDWSGFCGIKLWYWSHKKSKSIKEEGFELKFELGILKFELGMVVSQNSNLEENPKNLLMISSPKIGGKKDWFSRNVTSRAISYLRVEGQKQQ